MRGDGEIVMCNEDFSNLIHNFEQCYSLDAYHALRSDAAIGYEDYIPEVKQLNERCITAFFQAGDKGINCLLSVLEGKNLSLREKAATILGELISTDPANSDMIKGALENRLKTEPEKCVRRRIEYFLKY